MAKCEYISDFEIIVFKIIYAVFKGAEILHSSDVNSDKVPENKCAVSSVDVEILIPYTL